MEVSKKEYGLPTLDKQNELHVIAWEPQGQIKAVLQISHGMTEYIDRYDELAHFLAERGIYVIGNDHLGHGKSVKCKEDFGYFAPGDPSKIVVDNLYMITKKIQAEHTNVPYILLGHSMGSFLARRYVMTYGKHIDGCLLLGTGRKSRMVLVFGKCMTAILSLIQGDYYPSKLMRKLSTGNFDSFFNEKEGNWCTKDAEIIKACENDPYCDFIFTINGYKLLIDTVSFIQKQKNIRRIPQNLPIRFLSGDEDPVGDFGKAIKDICQKYQEAGLAEVSMKLYHGDRHELYHETDRQDVFEDIYQWICQRELIR